MGSWAIKDGVIPDDLRKLMGEWLRQRKPIFDGVTPPDPPWQIIPGISRYSIGWRMGGGEDYMIEFRSWFSGLDDAAKASYAALHPEPEGWTGFFASIERRSDGQSSEDAASKQAPGE